ncbi:MAG TPA: transcription elongation factor GreA [Candidatus Sulfomarinibacteraceae bacterium]|nr:transcription elongation factor GreA [Candidatus Sulfomarinibacteraceae bacterium]
MATKQKSHLITPEGLERLKNELKQLRTEGRQRIAERLENAFADGQDDEFVDNAELEAARNEQSFLEGRIQELEEILGNYQLIEENGPDDVVGVGNHVTVLEEDSEEEERYHLVGAAEADPVEGRISNESPLGKALLGAKVGDTVQVHAPNGLIRFRIIEIE